MVSIEATLLSEQQARNLLPIAIEGAIGKLTEEGYRKDDIYKVAVCSKLASLAIAELEGIAGVEHETHTSEDLTTHDFLVLRTTEKEILADGTWQQFLPHVLRSSDLPEILIGTREEVAARARLYGVPSEKATLWDISTKRDLYEMRRADEEDEVAADRAEKEGTWKVFTGFDDNRRARHRRTRRKLSH